MFIEDVLKVIYAPHKAFKQIVQNPKFIGPIFIMILFIVASFGPFYIYASRAYVESTSPSIGQNDVWTENRTLWKSDISSVTISENSNDYINGTLHGNKSVQFSIVNSSKISMQIDNLGSVNCSGEGGFKSLFLRIKQTSPDTNPENVTIYLFSNSSSYFHRSLTQNFSVQTINHWNNLTIPLNTAVWSASNASANWENITGLKLEFSWLSNYTITLLFDDMFYRGVFKSPLEGMSIDFLSANIIFGVLQYSISWLLPTVLVFIMGKALGAKIVWKTVLIVVGFTLIVLFVQALINTAAYSTLPTLHYRAESYSGLQAEREAAYNEVLAKADLAIQITTYAQIAILIWQVVLLIFAVHSSTEFTLSKSVLVAAVTYAVSYLVLRMFGF